MKNTPKLGFLDRWERPFIKFGWLYPWKGRLLAWMLLALISLFLSVGIASLFRLNFDLALSIPLIIIFFGFLRTAYIESESIASFIVFLLSIALVLWIAITIGAKDRYDFKLYLAFAVGLLFNIATLWLMKKFNFPGTMKK